MTRKLEGTALDRKTFASYLDKAYSDMEKELKRLRAWNTLPPQLTYAQQTI